MKRNTFIIIGFVSLLCLGAALEEPLRDWTGFRGVSLNQETYDGNFPLNMTGDANIVGDVVISGSVDTRDVSVDGATLDALVITVTGLQDVTLDNSATDGGMSINGSQRIFNRPATNAQTGYMTDALVTNIESNVTHSASDGTDHSDVVLSNTHRPSDGSDHTFIDQSVIIGSSPTLDGDNFTGIDANDVDIADAGGIITATETEGALQEHRTAIDLNTTHAASDGTDHTYIDQTVISGSSPTFDGDNFTGIDADDVDIADAGGIITATEVEGALQEHRTAINLNTTHRSSDGSDHTFIDQTVISGASPTFDGANFTGVDAVNVDIADVGGIITATEVEGALQENRTAVDLNTTHRGVTSGNPHQVTLEEARTVSNVLSGNIDFNNNDINDINSVQFQGGQAMSWNPTDYTIDVPTGLGPVLQVGQEQYILVYNDTGSQIDNGKAVYDSGVGNGLNTIALAKSDYFTNFATRVMMSTMDIPDANVGFCTLNGQVRDVNTNDWNVGDLLYIDPNILGGLTSTKPIFPNYPIQIGRVLVKHATAGVIQVGIVNDDEQQTTTNFWNGVFRESFDYLITSNGTVITGTLTPNNGHEDMTMMFSDGFTILDATPGPNVPMTAGTDAIPVINYVYIPQSTKVLTVSTSNWPSAEHIKISKCVLQTAVATQASGALRNQNYNDHIQSTAANQGHLSHMGHRIRSFNASYMSGIALTLKDQAGSVINTSGSGTSIELVTNAGVVFQMHEQAFEATDMYLDANDDAHIVNQVVDEGGAYSATTDLVTDITRYVDGSDAGAAIGSNKYFNIVVWGIQNKTGEPSHIMINLPTGQYTSPTNASADTAGTSIYDIPAAFKGVGFLIARLTFQLSSGWTYIAIEDLRGQVPSISAGVGVSTTAHDLLSNLDFSNAGHTGFFASDGSVDMTADANFGGFDLVNVHDVNGVDVGTDVPLNTAKETNVSTQLSIGTVTATTYGITSDGDTDDIVLPEADTDDAGLLGADKWDEIVANTLKVTNAIDISATPAVNQVMIWVDANTAKGDVDYVFDGNNLLINEAPAPASMDGGIAVKSGTGASGNITDGASIWVEDVNAIAGTAAWHWRVEDGTVGVIGHKSGYGTDNPFNRLHVMAASGYTSTEGVLILTNPDFASPGSTGSSMMFRFGANSGNTYSEILALNAGNGAFDDLILQSAGGNVGFGVVDPDEKVEVVGNVHVSVLEGGAVNLTADGSGNIIRDPSDAKFKKNIRPIENALDIVNQLEGRIFDWKDSRYGGENEFGLIANEVQSVNPRLAVSPVFPVDPNETTKEKNVRLKKKDESYLSVKWNGVAALLVEALKDQQVQINDLKNRLDAIE